MQRSRLNEGNDAKGKDIPAEAASENVDDLVSGFLDELTSLSTGIKQMPQPERLQETPVVISPETETEPPVIKIIGESRPEPSSEVDEINREIEESLSELERLKTKVVPIGDRKDQTPAPAIPPQTDVPAIPAAPADREKVASEERRTSADSGDQSWQRLEIFRSQVVSRRKFAWVKYVILALILIMLLGISIFYLFFKSEPTRIIPAANNATSAPPVFEQTLPSESVISSNATKAECISAVKPIYPQSARRYGIAGTVVLDIEINEKGDVVDARAVSGPGLFREAAEETVFQWKFKPASANGVSIASREQISISFNPLQ